MSFGTNLNRGLNVVRAVEYAKPANFSRLNTSLQACPRLGCLNPVGQYDPKSVWRITVALENAHWQKFSGTQKFFDTPFVIAALREAGRPLTLWDFAERFVGEHPSRLTHDMIRQRIQRCLKYMQARRAIVPVKIPGRRGLGWQLASPNNSDAGVPRSRPEKILNARQRSKVIAILAEAAPQALGTVEIARRFLAQDGIEPTDTAFKRTLGAVRCWLRELRNDEIVRSIKLPEKQELLWEVVNWCDEIVSEFSVKQADGPVALLGPQS